MACYIIVEIGVTDPEQYEEYKRQVEPTIAEFGGRYLVRGGAATLLEGEPELGRLVVLRFDSRERAMAWYGSDAYAGPKDIRHRSATSRLVAVEGLE